MFCYSQQVKKAHDDIHKTKTTRKHKRFEICAGQYLY